MKQIAKVIGMLWLGLVTGAAAAAEGGLASALRQVVETHLAAFNGEDPAAAMKTIHSKSPEYQRVNQFLPDQFAAMDARTALLSLHYIGHDHEFAVARVKYKTVDGSTDKFIDNILDTITVFHQEDGAWKYWSHHVLGVEIVN